MKSEVKYLSLWVLPVLFVLLQKSGGMPTPCVDKLCGSRTSCVLKKCVVLAGETITSATIFGITPNCFSIKSFGYFKDYIWIRGCCVMEVHVCYATPSQVNGDAIIVSTSTTVPAKTSDSSSKTFKVSNSTTGTTSSIRSVSVMATTTDQGSDDFEDNDFTIISTMTMVQASPFEMNIAQSDQDGEGNTNRTTSSIRSVSVMATTTDQGSDDFEDNDFTIISTMTMVQASLFEMNIAQSDQDGEGNTNIALKVALPVGICVLVILLVVLGFVFRRKVKGLMRKFRGPRDKSPDLLNPMYGINGPALEHTAGDKFDNLTYAMQTGQENIQSGNIPTGGYDYDKPLPDKKVGGQTNGNKSKTVGDSSASKYQPQYEEVGLKKSCDLYDTTYQKLCGERCNASYDHIMGSNAPTLITPQAKLGETAYDNAAI